MKEDDMLLRMLSVLGLIAINAFFVLAEFSIVSVRKSRISHLVAAGESRARTVQSLLESIERLLYTTQVGITLSSLALGWIGEKTIATLVRKGIASLPLPETVIDSITHFTAVPIAFFLLVYLQLVLGELCPKSLALLYSEQIALAVSPLSLTISRCFNPFVCFLNQSTRFILTLGKINYSSNSTYGNVTSEELRLIINTEKTAMGLGEHQLAILDNVFDLPDLMASEVMVTRTRLKVIKKGSNFKNLLQQIVDTGYSRYPVIDNSIDDVVGIIDFKDFALSLAKGNIKHSNSIDPWIKDGEFMLESTTLGDLLKLMQNKLIEMVVVVDEFGGTCGLLTQEDVINKIIGKNRDLTHQNITIEKIDENTYILQAQIDLEEVNEALKLDLPVLPDEYQTLGGFLLYQSQKVPIEGDIFTYDDIELQVISALGPRLEKIKITRKRQ